MDVSATAEFSPLMRRAVRYTICEEWQFAQSAWLRVTLAEGPSVIAALCGMQASLRLGNFDLFKYFRGLLRGPLPPELADQAAKSEKYAAARFEAAHGANPLDSLLEPGDADAHFARGQYDRALNGYLRGKLNAKRKARVAEIYYRTGRHDQYVELLKEIGSDATPEMKKQGERVMRLLERRDDPWPKIEKRFIEQHFAWKAAQADKVG